MNTTRVATKAKETPVDQNRTANRLDIQAIRKDFPALQQSVNGRPLVYMDNAATTQKPNSVIEAEAEYYRNDNANVHRGVHELSVRATEKYERARRDIQFFINAERAEEIIFVRGATEAINLVASSLARPRLRKGDEILISAMEHHSNIVPWQLVCQQTGAKLKVVPLNDRGELIFEQFEKLISEKTKLVAMVHVSNALGTINPIARVINAAHQRNIPVLIDGAQAIPHTKVDVQTLDADFYAFSGHKLYGPTGIGALYAKQSFLEEMPPYQGGGEMIRSVSFEESTYNELPYKFEAGTPNIAGAVGLGEAIKYLDSIGLDHIAAYENDLLEYATKRLQEIPGIRLIGTAQNKAAVLSFAIENVHPHDIGTLLDGQGIAIRSGHHCAQPVMNRFGVPATARASLAFYNTKEEIDALTDGIKKVIEVFH
jgi:cysteine desulfurase/selenocysteine lyase